MFLGNVIATDHALKQYNNRCRRKDKGSALASIRYDLRTMNIKNIVYTEDKVHVFTYGHKEFILAKTRKKDRFILKTFIQRNLKDTQNAIAIRKNSATIK